MSGRKAGKVRMRIICSQQAIEECHQALHQKTIKTLELTLKLLTTSFGKNGLQRKNNERIAWFYHQLTGKKIKVINETIHGGKGSRS